MRNKALEWFKILDGNCADVANVPEEHDPAEVNNVPLIKEGPSVDTSAFGKSLLEYVTLRIFGSG